MESIPEHQACRHRILAPCAYKQSGALGVFGMHHSSYAADRCYGRLGVRVYKQTGPAPYGRGAGCACRYSFSTVTAVPYASTSVTPAAMSFAS